MNKSVENNASKDFEQIAIELCEKALNDAMVQLHPLLRNVELERLEKRGEFVQAFRLALERRLAKKLADLLRGRIQTVYRFDETRRRPSSQWDGSIHLLVKASRLSSTIQAASQKLDQSLLKRLRELRWSQAWERHSILEVQQVTPKEIRRGLSYGAMFCSVYSAPVKVWPQHGWRDVSTPG